LRVGILSDIHDNLWNLAAAIRALSDADALICCGDLCSPFVIDELAKFGKDIHVVFGNNDADLYRITLKAAKKPNLHLHGELFEASLDGQRFGVNHFDYIARPMAKSGAYDVVCFGHNHEFEVRPQSRIRSRARGGLPAAESRAHHGSQVFKRRLGGCAAQFPAL